MNMGLYIVFTALHELFHTNYMNPQKKKWKKVNNIKEKSRGAVDIKGMKLRGFKMLNMCTNSDT